MTGPIRILAVAATALALAACTPPYIDKAYLPSAKDYYRACGWQSDCSAPADALSLDRVYAVHLYGRSFHPWRSAAGHVARRGIQDWEERSDLIYYLERIGRR